MEESLNLLETLAEFKDFKNIDRESLMRILEDIFHSALTKKYGPDANFEVIVNVDRGELEIQRYREIVEDGRVKNEFTQIAFSDAIKIEPDFEIGEEVVESTALIEYKEQNFIQKILNVITKFFKRKK